MLVLCFEEVGPPPPSVLILGPWAVALVGSVGQVIEGVALLEEVCHGVGFEVL